MALDILIIDDEDDIRDLIAGILAADEGKIVIDGEDVASLGESQRDRARAHWADSGETATDTVWLGLKDKLGGTDWQIEEADATDRLDRLVPRLRRSMLPFTGLWSFNEAILCAGQATADNLTPQIAQIDLAERGFELRRQYQHRHPVLIDAARRTVFGMHRAHQRQRVGVDPPAQPHHRPTDEQLEDAGFRQSRRRDRR